MLGDAEKRQREGKHPLEHPGSAEREPSLNSYPARGDCVSRTKSRCQYLTHPFPDIVNQISIFMGLPKMLFFLTEEGMMVGTLQAVRI